MSQCSARSLGFVLCLQDRRLELAVVIDGILRTLAVCCDDREDALRLQCRDSSVVRAHGAIQVNASEPGVAAMAAWARPRSCLLSSLGVIAVIECGPCRILAYGALQVIVVNF